MESLCVLVKHNILPVHAIKIYGGKGDIPPVILKPWHYMRRE